LEIRCINLPGRPTEEVYVCVQDAGGYKRVIPLYKLLSTDKLMKLNLLFKDLKIKGNEWMDEIGVREDEILSLYFSSPEGRAEKLFLELVESGIIPKPKDNLIVIESSGKKYKIEVDTLRLFIDDQESCFQCDEDLPHFDKLIALCLTIIHNPEKLERR